MSTKSSTNVYLWLKYIQFLLLPATCIVCRKLSGTHHDLCEDCHRLLPIVSRPCKQCALPLPSGYKKGYENDCELTCGACITQPPPFLITVTACSYAQPVNMLISQFKYQAKLQYGKVLTDLLLAQIRVRYQEMSLPELIIPVPLHSKRMKQRGFNQSILIAKHLGKALKIPVNTGSCIRINNTKAQMGLSAVERKNNLKGAFSTGRPCDFKRYSSIALVDDVLTTGSTMSEICHLLKKSGINDIHLWTLARA